MPPKQEISKVEKINLYANILGPICIMGVIAWAVWSVNARVTMEVQAEDKKNADAFVSKAWFEKSHDDTTKQISDVATTVGNLNTTLGNLNATVAEMKGELSVKQPATGK